MDRSRRQLAALAAGSAFLAVALGAFGAHALRDELSARHLEIFQTGVHYQMVHALGVLLVVALMPITRATWGRAAAWCFLAGTILFSGSLYTLALTGEGRFGAITPGGGLLFLVGWALLVASLVRPGAPVPSESPESGPAPDRQAQP